MEVQQYRKIVHKTEIPQCERMTGSLRGKVRCKFSASYIMGEEKLCKKHARIEALDLLIEGSHVYEE